jgi:hypothetical protein
MDVVFLEQMKMYETIHVLIMRRPFSWGPPDSIKAKIRKSSPFTLVVWLDVWAHVLEVLLSKNVKSFTVVQYETLVSHPMEVSLELMRLLQAECGIPIDLHDEQSRR